MTPGKKSVKSPKANTRIAKRARPTLSTPELIAKKRDGGVLSDAEIQHIVAGFTRGDVADYQMSALAMAIFIRGMTPAETVALTLAMRDSGHVVDLSSVKGVKVDKHSTGGVGDKVSICLAPLVAACGVPVPMISGRGLGHTGGTLDKLEAIAGFTVGLSTEAFVRQIRDVGCALVGQTADLAPADKKLYALRDVTATVESIPLITASILSKKLASGLDALVLDVKVGKGAFMTTTAQARELAASLVRVGRLAKKEVTAFITSMEAPLGRAIGNALETAEALEILRGGGPDDLKELTLVLGAEMLLLGKVAKNERDARAMLEAAIKDRRGAGRMRQIIRAQGGDARVVDEPDRLPRAKVVRELRANTAGVVMGIDPLSLGLTGVAMGAGRTRADQTVDPRVGIVIRAQVGSSVKRGQAIAELHLTPEHDEAALSERVRSAFTIGRGPAKAPKLVLDVVRR